MSGLMSMFDSSAGKYGKGGAANSAGVISSAGSMGGGLGGFVSSYGGAIMSGLSTVFAGRSASKDAARQAKLTKEQAELQRKYDVEDSEFARTNQLADRKTRQNMLNPYAGYSNGV